MDNFSSTHRIYILKYYMFGLFVGTSMASPFKIMEQLVARLKPLERPQQDSVNSDHFTIFGPMEKKLLY